MAWPGMTSWLIVLYRKFKCFAQKDAYNATVEMRRSVNLQVLAGKERFAEL